MNVEFFPKLLLKTQIPFNAITKSVINPGILRTGDELERRKMEYPKEIMSVKELMELGFTKEFLRQLSHARNAPCFKTSSAPNAKIYFYTSKLDEYIEKYFK